jgi:predicted unusual protein kinase regulating ubiquinone biosynthesis (AarF/ABC1/UbiB family)
MVGELSVRQRLHLINLLSTSTEGDPTALARALLSLSVPFRQTSPEGFTRDFERGVGPYLDVDEGELVPFAQIMSVSVDLLRKHGYRPDPQLTLATKALTQAEAFTAVLYPPGTASSFAPKAVEMVRELAADAVTRESVEAFARKQAGYVARDALESLPSLELGVLSWLKQIRAGQLSVKVDTSELNEQVGTLMRMSRLLTVGVLIGCVIIASAVAANVSASGHLGTLRDVALVSYAVALVTAGVVVIRLLRGAFKKPKE